MTFKDLRQLFLLLILLVFFSPVLADDPGITKVRLIQESDSSYVFELDISAQYLWTLAPPILPEGFEVSDPVYEDQSGWITVIAKITTAGTSFSPEDVIILPWQRAGADITVQWTDGHTFKGLYYRSLEGIRIPMVELMPLDKTRGEVLREYFVLGLKHLPFKLIHPFLVFVLVFAYRSARVFRYLFYITLGQMFAMVLFELGIPGPDLLFIELAICILILLIIITRTYRLRFRFLGFILFLTGVLHSLALSREFPVSDLEPLQRIEALFAFNLAMDFGHYVLAFFLLMWVKLIKQDLFKQYWFQVICGSAGIFLMLLLFSSHVATGEMQILSRTNNQGSFTYKSYAPQKSLTARQVQRGKGMMTTPLMIFLSIEAHELRQEILVLASEAIHYTNAGNELDLLIPVEAQEQLKQELQDTLYSSFSIHVDKQLLHPADMVTNFVILGRGGVATRESPVAESLDEAILGLTFIYDLESLPDSISMDWRLFSESMFSIEASAVDPFGAFTSNLFPGSNILRWENRLAAYRVPAIRAIAIEKQARPIFSILIWSLLGIMAIRLLVIKKNFKPQRWMIIFLVLSFLIYPFMRIKMDLPFLPQAKPSPERAETILNKLLSNTYRAFDRRNEDDVYDLLSLSVSGDQLTEIFIQNRQAMALENRGGARAKVDEVQIRELLEFKRLGEQSYLAETSWTIRGSVNHFGHTHYRQNQYKALVIFGIEEDCWKILNIEILDTRRLY